MLAIVFNDKTVALKYGADVDAALGYPKAGLDIGGGIHVAPALSMTVRHNQVLEKPVTKDAWAYPSDAISTVAKTPPKPPETLDASWDGAVPTK